jgi:hypothetical protein
MTWVKTLVDLELDTDGDWRNGFLGTVMSKPMDDERNGR